MDNNRRKARCKARDKESHCSVAMVRELRTKTIATFGPGMVEGVFCEADTKSTCLECEERRARQGLVIKLATIYS